MNKNLKLKIVNYKKYLPDFIIGFYHWSLAWLAAASYGFPSRRMVVIGITGTNGKTTTVLMTTRILEEAGFKVGSVSSIWYKIGKSEKPNPLHMTMPGRFRLQKLLRQMVKAGCQYAVLEVTSEGIKQHRHCGINFDVAVLTNLSPEHIESHGSFEKYRQAKAKLFAGLALGLRKRLSVGTGRRPVLQRQVFKVIVVNLDDKNADYFLKFKADKKYGFRIKNQESRIENREKRIGNGELRMEYQEFNQIIRKIEAGGVILKEKYSQFSILNSQFSISLPGQFNINNALAAICVGLSQNVSLEKIKTALAKIKTVAGRMEVVQRKPFTVIVDLAHTPPAAEAIYQICQKMLVAGAKIITVFGAAGGGRDKWKRPRLGELAAKYCDKIILTNEDPYDEEPEKIIDDIVSGIPVRRRNEAPPRSCNKNVFKIPDRRQAICQALNLARPKDIVLILGKGTEPTMVFADGKKIPWDDRQVAREALAQLRV